MTPEDRAAALISDWYGEAISRQQMGNAIAAAIYDAIEEEREACAEIAESFSVETANDRVWAALETAKEIRKRGEQ